MLRTPSKLVQQFTFIAYLSNYNDNGINEVIIKNRTNTKSLNGRIIITGGYNRGNYSGLAEYSIYRDAGDYIALSCINGSFGVDANRYSSFALTPLRGDDTGFKLTLLSKEQSVSFRIIYENQNVTNENHLDFYLASSHKIDLTDISDLVVLYPGDKYVWDSNGIYRYNIFDHYNFGNNTTAIADLLKKNLRINIWNNTFFRPNEGRRCLKIA